MATDVDVALVKELGRAVVEGIAADEIFLYDRNADAYFKNPQKALNSAVGKDPLLGLGGAGELAIFLTPFVLDALMAVVSYLQTILLDAAKTQGKEAMNDLIKYLFTGLFKGGPGDKQPHGEPPPDMPALTLDQLSEVRHLIIARAKKLKLKDATAKLLADAVVGGLAVHA